MRQPFTRMLMLVASLQSLALAQWPSTPAADVPVCTALGPQVKAVMAMDFKGGAIIAWDDGRSASGAHDVYAQRIGHDGVAMWQPDGVPVCSRPQTNDEAISICSDTSGGAFIVWQSTILNGQDGHIYAQHVDSNGTTLWASNGILAIDTIHYTYGDYNPAVISDFQGGAYVVLQRVYPLGYQIRAQHLDGSGNRLWGGGRPVCGASESAESPQAVYIPGGGIAVVWHNVYLHKLLAQRMDEAGNQLWDTTGVLAVTDVADGQDGGFSVSEANSPTGPEAAVAMTWMNVNNGWIYGQVINVDGSRRWGTNGIVINHDSHSTLPMITRNLIVGDDSSAYYVVWQDGRRSGIASDIYAQRVRADGSIVWTPNGVAVCVNPASSCTNPNLLISGRGYGGDKVMVVWQGFGTTGGAPGLYIQRLNEDSTKEWQSDGVYLSTKRGSAARMVSDGRLGVQGGIICFSDFGPPNASDYNVYAKHINPDGTLGPVTHVSEEQGSPTEFRLTQNYPNPFNPTTRITFQLPTGGFVTLNVFDVLGREVATLANENLKAGTYTRELNATNLASGIYFATLRGSSFTKSIKMLLVR